MTSEEIQKYILQLTGEIRKAEVNNDKQENLARLEQIAKEYKGEDKLVSSAEIAERMKNRKEVPHFNTGFNGLDDILKGIYPEQLVVISAATKSGKTSFCIDMTSKLKEINPVWLTFEESAEELIQKFFDRAEEPPHFYTPDKVTGNTLQWVEKKIIEAKAKFNSKVVFIDHLHFIVPFSAERQDLAIGQAMRELKSMAKRWHVIIFLIAHLKKTKLESQPELDDLRDSSFVAQEADTVIMLWRESFKENGQVIITNNINVSVQANRRNGRTGNIKMVYDNGHFHEQDWSDSDMDITKDVEKKWA